MGTHPAAHQNKERKEILTLRHFLPRCHIFSPAGPDVRIGFHLGSDIGCCWAATQSCSSLTAWQTSGSARAHSAYPAWRGTLDAAAVVVAGAAVVAEACYQNQEVSNWQNRRLPGRLRPRLHLLFQLRPHRDRRASRWCHCRSL